jgi:hypothetical protein
MKQLLGIIFAAAIVISVVPNARSIGSLSPPHGVSANDWIPLGDAAGFVIAHNETTPTAINPAVGTVKGYFMVRRKDSWLRVDSTPDYGVQKAAMQR